MKMTKIEIQRLVDAANEQRRKNCEQQAIGLITAIQQQLDYRDTQTQALRVQCDANIASMRKQLENLPIFRPITAEDILGERYTPGH